MFKIFYYFLFCKNKFTELEIDRICEANFTSNIEFKKKYLTRESIPEKQIEEWRNSVNERAHKLRMSILHSFLITFIILILSAALSYTFSPESWLSKLSKNSVLLVVSTFLLLWATYGKLGWEIQTIKGSSYVEKINDCWFRIIFGFGMFFLFLAIFIGADN
ncbi:MAG TPA: hypothetical protein ACFYD5_04755 [Candidatus Tripitaka sp. YC43]